MMSTEIDWEREQVIKAIDFLENQLRNTSDHFQKKEVIQNIGNLKKRLLELNAEVFN